MKFEEAEIDDPREIFAAVRQTAEEAENDLYRIGLNHNHTSAVRGYNEIETGLTENIGSPTDYPIEITREDGGDTWYHSPQSRCLMLGVPEHSKNHTGYMKAWGNSLATKLEEYAEEENLDISPVYRGEEDVTGVAGDIYDEETGKQLIGLSGKSFDDSFVVRACMYAGEEHGEMFDKIVDLDTGDADSFHQDYRAVEGFYEYIMAEEASERSEVEIEEHLEPDTSPDKGRNPSPCIGKAF